MRNLSAGDDYEKFLSEKLEIQTEEDPMKAVNDLKKFLASFDDIPSTPREGDKTETDLEVPVPNPFDSIK